MRLFTSLYFHCRIFVSKLIMNEPNCREMSPSEFLNNYILLIKLLSQYYRMITVRAVINVILALRFVFVLIIFLFKHN